MGGYFSTTSAMVGYFSTTSAMVGYLSTTSAMVGYFSTTSAMVGWLYKQKIINNLKSPCSPMVARREDSVDGGFRMGRPPRRPPGLEVDGASVAVASGLGDPRPSVLAEK